MLVLRRKEGQWIDLIHKSGDVIRIRVCNVRARYPGQMDMAFDDDARNFAIERPERGPRPVETRGSVSEEMGAAAATPEMGFR